MNQRIDSDRQPVVVRPDEGDMLDAISVRHRLTGRQTSNACYLLEAEFEPGAGNRLHVHHREDEIAYVLEGALAIRTQGGTVEIGPGGVGYLPKGVPHAISNPPATTSCYIFMAVPGGNLEFFFDELQAAAKSGALNADAFNEISNRYGIDWLE